MTTVIGLDLGTKCGFAIMNKREDLGTLLVSGVWNCSIKTKQDSPSLRFAKFESQLNDALAVGVDRVYFEIVRNHKGVEAAHIYGALMAKMQECCDKQGVPFQGLEVGHIKKYATGKGNASKDQMIEAVRLWGFDPADDNEADAIAIAHYGWETHG